MSRAIRKIEEATKYSAEARRNKYYHSPTDPCHALGVPPSLYLQQFPQFYYGNTKDGLPIFYAKAGLINTKSIGCVTTTEGVLKYHWYEMYQKRNEIYQTYFKPSNGKLQKRYEILYILDLKHLSTSQLNKQLVNITKIQCKIDELCFPELMMKMIIVNAPSCFPIFWRIVKAWIDPRNAAKVEVFGCNRAQWEERILQFVEKDQLPSDYGGLERNGTSMDIMRQQMVKQYKDINPDVTMVDEQTYFLTFHRQESIQQVEVKEGLKLSLFIYTNSRSEGVLQITDEKGHLVDGIPSQGIRIIHIGGNDSEGDVSSSTPPSKYDLKQMGINLEVPGFYDIKIRLSERLRGNFLLVSHYYKENKQKEEIQFSPMTVKRKQVLVADGSCQSKSYSLGIGRFLLDDNMDDHQQVEFHQYEYMCEC